MLAGTTSSAKRRPPNSTEGSHSLRLSTRQFARQQEDVVVVEDFHGSGSVNKIRALTLKPGSAKENRAPKFGPSGEFCGASAARSAQPDPRCTRGRPSRRARPASAAPARAAEVAQALEEGQVGDQLVSDDSAPRSSCASMRCVRSAQPALQPPEGESRGGVPRRSLRPAAWPRAAGVEASSARVRMSSAVTSTLPWSTWAERDDEQIPARAQTAGTTPDWRCSRRPSRVRRRSSRHRGAASAGGPRRARRSRSTRRWRTGAASRCRRAWQR